MSLSQWVQIVIAQWAGPETGSWSDWSSILHSLWHDDEWSERFYIAQTTFPGTSQPLHAHIQQLTATACSICDPQGSHSFPTYSALCKHMTRQHQRQPCRICLRVRAYLLTSPPADHAASVFPFVKLSPLIHVWQRCSCCLFINCSKCQDSLGVVPGACSVAIFSWLCYLFAQPKTPTALGNGAKHRPCSCKQMY